MAAIADDYSYSTTGAITYGPKSARLCDLTAWRDHLVRCLATARQRQRTATGGHVALYANVCRLYEGEIIAVSQQITARKRRNRAAYQRRKNLPKPQILTVAPALASA